MVVSPAPSRGTYLPYLPTIYGIYISKFGYKVGVGRYHPPTRPQALTPEVITTAWDGSDRLEVVSLAQATGPAWFLHTFQPIYITFQGTRCSKNGKIIIKTWVARSCNGHKNLLGGATPYLPTS